MPDGLDWSWGEEGRRKQDSSTPITGTGDTGDKLCCTLETVSLLSSSMPVFSAISYSWGVKRFGAGDLTHRKTILLDGRPVIVPGTTYDALRRFQHSDQRETPLWIDAICVNQADLVERGHQVSFVQDVYAKANKVLIWLGEEDNGTTGQAINSINLLLEQSRAHTDGDGEFNSVAGTIPVAALDETFPARCDWPAFDSFYACAWFRRLWVFQEASLAQKAICYRGKCQIDWNSAACAAAWVMHKQSSNYLNAMGRRLGLRNAAMMWWYRRHVSNGVTPNSGLSQLLEVATTFDVSDSKDRVFALLGMMNDGWWPEELRPDYHRSVVDIYSSAVRVSLEERGDLRLLQHTQVWRPLDPLREALDLFIWPSWVPRWDWGWNRRCCHLLPELDFCADLGTPMSKEPIAPLETILRVRGIRLYEVQKTSPNIDWYGFQRQAAEGRADTLHLLWSIAKLGNSSDDQRVGVSTNIRDFGATLVAGANWNQISIAQDPSFYEDFAAFLEAHGGGRHGGGRLLFDQEVKLGPRLGNADRYLEALRDHSSNRRFFECSTGHMGLGSHAVEQGDVVCILFGHFAPFILRRTDSAWKLKGNAYVHGIMHVSGSFAEFALRMVLIATHREKLSRHSAMAKASTLVRSGLIFADWRLARGRMQEVGSSRFTSTCRQAAVFRFS